MIASKAAKFPAPTQPSEHKVQAMLVDYATNKYRREMYVFAIPNAAKRSFAMAAKMKAEGLRAGVADLCVMRPNGWTGFIECKKSEREQLSDPQLGFQAICNRFSHPHAVVYSYEQGVQVLEMWRHM